MVDSIVSPSERPKTRHYRVLKYLIFEKKFVTCNSILMIHFYNSYKISLVNNNETDKKKEKVLKSFQYLQSLEKLFNGSMVS